MAAAARGSALPGATATRASLGSAGFRGDDPPGTPRSSMDAALGLACPGPAPAARVGPSVDPERAGRAADRRVAVVDQRVDQHSVGGDVVVDLLLGPADDRVDLDHLPAVVPLDHLGLAAVAGLVPADAGDPRVIVGQRPLQRLHLAQVAAQVRVTPVEPGAELGVLLGDGAGRGDVNQVDRVHDLDRVPGAYRLGEVVTGVEEDHVDAGPDGRGQVDDHRVGHGGGDADPVAEGVGGPA